MAGKDSNYPPGVSGSEPQITGEPPADADTGDTSVILWRPKVGSGAWEVMCEFGGGIAADEAANILLQYLIRKAKVDGREYVYTGTTRARNSDAYAAALDAWDLDHAPEFP